MLGLFLKTKISSRGQAAEILKMCPGSYRKSVRKFACYRLLIHNFTSFIPMFPPFRYTLRASLGVFHFKDP